MERISVALVTLAAAVSACGNGGGEGPGDRDTLAVEVPAEERMERGARAIGGTVGEALEETGEAIEEAGRRIREEAGEPVAGDTSRM